MQFYLRPKMSMSTYLFGSNTIIDMSKLLILINQWSINQSMKSWNTVFCPVYFPPVHIVALKSAHIHDYTLRLLGSFFIMFASWF